LLWSVGDYLLNSCPKLTKLSFGSEIYSWGTISMFASTNTSNIDLYLGEVEIAKAVDKTWRDKTWKSINPYTPPSST
jgi:hypothetical protein